LTGYSSDEDEESLSDDVLSDEDPVSSDDSELVSGDDGGRGELARSNVGPIALMDGFGWDAGGEPRAGGDGGGNGRSARGGTGRATKDGFGGDAGGELG
jgi:hypothetical protein